MDIIEDYLIITDDEPLFAVLRLTRDSNNLKVQKTCIGYNIDGELSLESCTNTTIKFYWDEFFQQMSTTVDGDKECLSTIEDRIFLKSCDFSSQNQKWEWKINPESLSRKANYSNALYVKARKSLSVLLQNIKTKHNVFMEELDKTINTGFSTDSLNAKLEKIKLIKDYEAEKAILISNAQLTVTTDLQKWAIKNQKIIEQDEIEDICTMMETCKTDEQMDMETAYRDQLYVKHHVYVEQRALERENHLAKEINDVYCKLRKLQKHQTQMLSHVSGIVAARALNLPLCSRIQAHGEVLVLHQCESTTVQFGAQLTKCGYQPMLNDSTISKDGYTLVEFQPCYWQHGFVNFNGIAHEYQSESSQWIPRKPTVRSKVMTLVSHFEAVENNEMDYLVQMHAAHTQPVLDSINILGDIASHMQESNSGTLDPFLKTFELTVGSTGWISTTMYYIKLALVIGLVVFVIVPIALRLGPVLKLLMIGYRQKRKTRREAINNINLNEVTPLASAPPVDIQCNNLLPQICPNLHKKLVLTATNGYTWEDGCPISV